MNLAVFPAARVLPFEPKSSRFIEETTVEPFSTVIRSVDPLGVNRTAFFETLSKVNVRRTGVTPRVEE